MANDADIKICAAALQLIGADEITSFTDENREARVCAAIYDNLKKNTLQEHNWRFSIRQEALSKLSATPLFEFKYAYQLPTDFLRFIGKQNPEIKHQIFENKIYTDADSLFINMQYDVSAQYFPAYFTHLLTLKLCSLLSISLLEDVNKSKIFLEAIATQNIMARNIDSQNNTISALNNNVFSLTAIRY